MAKIQIGTTTLSPSGAKGEIGLNGAAGLSAYQIAVNNGFVGNETAWLTSLQGANGEAGVAAVVIEPTDNLNVGADWIIGDTPDYLADAYLVLNTNGSRYITMYDEWGLQSFSNAARPQIVEYNVNNTVVRTQLTEIAALGETNKTKWKRWNLSATTTYVHVLIPDNSVFYTGALTSSSLEANMRITIGSYFTQETKPFKIASIDGISIPNKSRNKLFGKTIALFGDSITDEKGTIGSRSAFTQKWVRELELSVFNYAEGSAGLTDWSDTVLVTDGSPTTVSHNNVVSNQIEEMIVKVVVPDIVILTGGTNDSYRGRLKGTLATAITNYDSPELQDKQTYYGLFFWAVKKLRTLNPDVKIFLMKPIKGVPEGDFTAINTQMAIVWQSYDEVYSELGVQLIDAKNLLPIIGSLANNTYYADALHPSVFGKDNVMSIFILNEIYKSVINNY